MDQTTATTCSRISVWRRSGDEHELPTSTFSNRRKGTGEKVKGPSNRQGDRGSGGLRRRRSPPKLVNGDGGGRSVLGQKSGSLAVENWGFWGEMECRVVGYLYPKFGGEAIRNRNESRDFSGCSSVHEELVFFLQFVSSWEMVSCWAGSWLADWLAAGPWLAAGRPVLSSFFLPFFSFRISKLIQIFL